MAEKFYINPVDFQHDIWRLAKQILESGWKPDIMIALWRGGANVGAGIHDYLAFHGWRFDHTCVKCSSYVGIGEREESVRFDDAAEFVFSRIAPSQKVLIVDDVFDTGKTIEKVAQRLAHADLRSACVYWKECNNLTEMNPDYFVSKSDSWLVFPHEIQGLTENEIEMKDSFLKKLF